MRHRFNHLIAAGFLTASQAMGAGFAGNGCDTLPAELGSAWYLGKDAIVHVCIDLAPGFGASRAEVEDAFNWASGKWVEYIGAKKVNGLRPHDFDNAQGIFASEEEAAAHLLATRLALQESCDGREDLRIEAGTSSPESQAALARLEKPIAFALPVSADLRVRWTKGLIWLAASGTLIRADAAYHGHPYWAHAPNLRIVLLHELGHVFGIGHAAGTIMEENLEGILRYPAVPASDRRTRLDHQYSQIDRQIELVLCESCAMTYREDAETHSEILNVLRDPFGLWPQILGRPVSDDYAVTVTTTADPIAPSQFIVNFADAFGAAALPIVQGGVLGTKFGDLAVFKRSYAYRSNQGWTNFITSISLRTDAVTWLGEMTVPDGSKRQVVIGRNMMSQAFMLGVIEGATPFAGPNWFFVGKSGF